LKKATGIIPARYGSTRFPGKPLALILGKPMIQWVYEKTCAAHLLDRVIIATDDARIFKTARGFGAEVINTSSKHNSGTERAAEAAASISSPIIINIQGDEPLIHAQMIDDLIKAFQDGTFPMATLSVKSEDFSQLHDSDVVKVVMDHKGFALYFSRAPIPQGARKFFWKHIGIYAYQRDFLQQWKDLSPSWLSDSENLEQLKVLENGFKIKIIPTSYSTISVDCPEDIPKVEARIMKEGNE